MNNNKIIGARGERLLRLTSAKGRQIKNADSFSVCYGGAEGNVLRSLSCLGRKTRFLSKMGKDEISQAAVLSLKRAGVDTSFVVRDENPLGIYFLEEGEGKRPSKVVYHRKGSSATTRKPEDFDFKKALEGVSLFHISGISLCLTKTRRDTVRECLKTCKERHIPVSFDFNYRPSLLPLDEAKKIYPEVAKYCDILFASKWDIQILLGFHPEETDEDKVFLGVCKEKGYRYVFTKKRTILDDRNQRILPIGYTSKEKVIGREEDRYIFDRIGAGDSFAAGVLYGVANERSTRESLDLGIANCALEQTIFGDHANFSIEELQEYLSSGKEERKR